MSVTPSGIVVSVIFEQFSKAFIPIDLIEFGIKTDVTLEQSLKAEF